MTTTSDQHRTLDRPVAPHRVAVYFAPAVESGLWHSGVEWLGRCAASGRTVAQPLLRDVDARTQTALTAEPRRYGWHATLKPPFRLSPESSLDSLRGALKELCASLTPFDARPLCVSRLGEFLALRPVAPDPRLDALAARCVTQLQPWAAPLDALELRRRRRTALSDEEDYLLCRWGYPWVLHRFRFHFSLTGPLTSLSVGDQARVYDAARSHFGHPIALRMDRLSLFAELQPGADFVLLEQFMLTSSETEPGTPAPGR